MSGDKGPVAEWLLRAARECGTPGRMMDEARTMANVNTRYLLEEFARRWYERAVLTQGAAQPENLRTNGKA